MSSYSTLLVHELRFPATKYSCLMTYMNWNECQGRCWGMETPTSQEETDCTIWVVTMTNPNLWKSPQWIQQCPHPARPVRLLWNFIIWWYGTRGSLEQLLHGSEIMCSSLTVEIEGPGWGWGGKTSAPRSEESLLWIWRLALEISVNGSQHLVGGVSAATRAFTAKDFDLLTLVINSRLASPWNDKAKCNFISFASLTAWLFKPNLRLF